MTDSPLTYAFHVSRTHSRPCLPFFGKGRKYTSFLERKRERERESFALHWPYFRCEWKSRRRMRRWMSVSWRHPQEGGKLSIDFNRRRKWIRGVHREVESNSVQRTFLFTDNAIVRQHVLWMKKARILVQECLFLSLLNVLTLRMPVLLERLASVAGACCSKTRTNKALLHVCLLARL
jgi:hypothetical protein